MCWGIQQYFFCNMCRVETALDINWQGCHIMPFNHPGFSDDKPVVDVFRVEYPEPTAYESCSDIENLAGTADELPSYAKTMSETPLPPSYEMTELRDADYDGLFIPIIAYDLAVQRHSQLMSVAKEYRRRIDKYLNQGPPLATMQILDYLTEVIETFLFEQEQLISRINLLQDHLEIVDAEIAALPSPSEMALLEGRRQGIYRELEGHAESQNTMENAEDWRLRLDSLLEHAGYDVNVDDGVYAPGRDC
ncbi:hypothetical protein E4T50_16346 [Aureobasidium sp. EXF-12298]|nr:hypothetical protein E4T50_16346 [Aureobasidium sp. EXF-12298]